MGRGDQSIIATPPVSREVAVVELLRRPTLSHANNLRKRYGDYDAKRKEDARSENHWCCLGPSFAAYRCGRSVMLGVRRCDAQERNSCPFVGSVCKTALSLSRFRARSPVRQPYSVSGVVSGVFRSFRSPARKTSANGRRHSRRQRRYPVGGQRNALPRNDHAQPTVPSRPPAACPSAHPASSAHRATRTSSRCDAPSNPSTPFPPWPSRIDSADRGCRACCPGRRRTP